MNNLIRRIRPESFLSFGPGTTGIELRSLNVLIGPNASGKSNLLEAIGLLRALPGDVRSPISDGGGVQEWIWKGEGTSSTATIDAVVEYPEGKQPLRYHLEFGENAQRFELVDERIENEQPYGAHPQPYFYFKYESGWPVVNVRDEERRLRRETINPEQSILSQRKDPDQYPELTYLGDTFGRIRLYRDWSFGRSAATRAAQRVDLLADFLSEDARNLGLVLNRLQGEPKMKSQVLAALRKLYEDVTGFGFNIVGGRLEVFVEEGQISVPATRLSDGTLRYLCLLAILCHPQPPPLVCIEEPELGLHPDILPSLGDLLRDASERCQLIVTTHSEVLVDTLTDTPESVIVCEKRAGKTELRRLSEADLDEWLERYSLGELWSKGELGGNRW